GLAAKERPPRGTGRPRCGVEPVTTEGRADRGRGDLHAKLMEFALDALVASARVLPSRPDDQLLYPLIQGSPADPMWVGPRADHQASVPAQQRLGSDEEAGPAGPGQVAADGGE